MQTRDILSSSLASEVLTWSSAVEVRRVFTHPHYDVFLNYFSGGLVTVLVHYKQESLRIMIRGSKLTDPLSTPCQGWADNIVADFRSKGLSPMHLVRDAKLESKLPLTLHDRAALKIAGIEVPKAAGRFRDLFPESAEK